MIDWHVPSTIKALKGFLDLTGLYHKFTKGCASIVAPFTTLLKKKSFLWSPKATQAFLALKKAMVDASMLTLPNFSKPFILQIDALGHGMGVVLSQTREPIAFFSKLFPPKFLSSSTYLRELHAITVAVKKWCQYLLGHFFTI